MTNGMWVEWEISGRQRHCFCAGFPTLEMRGLYFLLHQIREKNTGRSNDFVRIRRNHPHPQKK